MKKGAFIIRIVILIGLLGQGCASSKLDKAKIALKKKDIASAEKLLEDVQSGQSQSPESLFWLGKIKYKKGEYKQASFLLERARVSGELGLEQLQEIDQISKSLSGYWFSSGINYYNTAVNILLGDREEDVSKVLDTAQAFVEMTDRVSQGDSIKSRIYEAFAKIFYLKKDPQRAEEYLAKQTDGKLGNDDYKILASLYNDIGAYDNTISISKEALKIDEDFYDVKKILAYAYIQVGNITDAMTLLSDVLKKLPNDKEIVFLMGYCEQSQGNHQLAKEHYERVLSIDVRFQEATYNYAYTCMKLAEELDGEQQAIEKRVLLQNGITRLLRIREDEKKKETWKLLALLYKRQGEEEKAKESVEKALSFDSTEE